MPPPPPKGNHPAPSASQFQPQPPLQEAKHPPRHPENATPLPTKGNHAEAKAPLRRLTDPLRMDGHLNPERAGY